MGARVIVESDLSKPVADWLRANGYGTVYAEVGRGPIDLVGWDQAGDRLACVELKMALTWKVLRQAMLAQIITVTSYAAVGTLPRKSSVAKAAKIGVGVLAVRNGHITVICEPCLKIEPWEPERKVLIDCLRASTPCDVGGVPCLPGIGPAQSCARAVREYLKIHPRTNWRTIFAEVPNHYCSAKSLSQVMTGRFGIFLNSQEWKRKQWEFVQREKERGAGQMALFGEGGRDG